MISKFFIERPVLANVIAILMVLIGAVALYDLPIAQYPDVVPPTVQVATRYPGASARTLIDTVALPIEQQVNGVENMLYMQSTSASDGTYVLTVTFKIGTNLDTAQILVQNRVASALSSLPDAVQAQGVTVQKLSTAVLLFVTLTSPDGRYDSLYLANYATINLKDELARLPGVGNVLVFGAGQYSMRIWLDPDKLKARSLNAQEVVQSLQQQSEQVAAGQVGMPPAPPSVDFQYTIDVLGRLNDVGEFEDVIVKTGANGEVTRLRDVGRVELGAQTYSQIFTLNGKPAAGIGVFQLPGANALQVEKAVKAKMAELARVFPQGLASATPFDTTVFVNELIREVYKTLIEAAVLVLLVISIFLQDWRAMLIPATTVPVTIIGAFAAMWALGFTVNFSTLFAIVLSIGIVVDDAIVVVENASRNVERGMNGHDAAIQAMKELLGPIIGITLVLMSAFLPAAFLPGLTGRMYAQFALVIAATALLSAINALTLKPTQSALWLRPPVPPERRNAFYRGFNSVYARLERGYAGLIGRMVKRSGLMAVIALAIIAVAAWGLARVPTGFLPIEDQGYLIVAVQLPDGAALGRTQQALDQVTAIARKDPSVDQVVSIAGVSAFDNSAALANAGVAYVILKPWSAREDLLTLFNRMSTAFATVDASVATFPPPPIQGIGNAGGFTLQVELRDGSTDLAKLQSATDAMVTNAQSQTAIQFVSSSFRALAPQLRVEVNRVKAQTLHVTLDQVFATLSTYLGSAYVTQLNKFGRVFQVYAQADAPFRLRPRDIENSVGAQPAGRHDPARNDCGDYSDLRRLADQSLQPLSLLEHHRAAGVGLQLRRGKPSHGGECGAHSAPGHGHRMDGDVLSRAGRRPPDVFCFRDGAAADLSGAGRAVRELVCAARGYSVGAVGAGRTGAGPLHSAHRQQSLHADRHYPADRAVGQERHPHRRGGPGAASHRRQAHPRRRGRGGASALPGDSHDVVRLHPRRFSARDLEWRRRERAQVDRHHGVQRHAGVDLPCRSFRAGDVLRGAAL